MCCKLQSCSNHKQHEDEDDIVELGESDNDIDGKVDVWLLCLPIMFEHNYHATHTTSGNQNRRKMTASTSVI